MWLAVLISVLAILFLLLSAAAFYAFVYHEDFEDQKNKQEQEQEEEQEQQEKLKAGYDNYATFYNAFQATWEKAVTTSLGSSTPPTRTELNAQVNVLSKGRSLPLITDALPPTLDLQTFQPVHQLSLLNALQWMNQHMEESQAALQNALKGNPLEGFADGSPTAWPEGPPEGFAVKGLPEPFEDAPPTPAMCQQLIQCNKQQEQEKIAPLLDYFQRFEANQELQDAWTENQRLAAESKKIQDQAQSGELAAQFSSSESSITFEKPAGARKGAEWAEYKKTHPKEAAKTEKTLGPLAAVADWAHQMNRRF